MPDLRVRGITDNPFPKSFSNGEPVRIRGRSRICVVWSRISREVWVSNFA